MVTSLEIPCELASQSPTTLAHIFLNFFKKVFRYIGIFCIVILCIYGMTFLLSPSTNRDWTEDVQKLAQISFS